MHRAFIVLVGIASMLVPLVSAAGGRAERVSTVNSLLDERPAAPKERRLPERRRPLHAAPGAERGQRRNAVRQLGRRPPHGRSGLLAHPNEPTSVTAKFNRKAMK
jgi:hypothetical protein